jgi:S-formylglutathione hydrolase
VWGAGEGQLDWARTRAISFLYRLVGMMTARFAAALFAAGLVWAQAPAGLKGKLERIKIHGASLEGNLSGDAADRDVSIYLPPSYATSPARRYPVVYLLHGFTDADDLWFGLRGQHFVNVPVAVDKAWAAGAAEMIVVMPNAYTKFAGSMYSNSAATGDWESYVARELVAYMDGHYRTIAGREGRGLAGHSMGGYGALRIGMKYPDVFAAMYALSPCCMAPNMGPSVEQMEKVAAIRTPAEFDKADFGVKAMAASAAAWSPNPNNPPFFFDLPVQDGKPVPNIIAKWAANAPLTMVSQYIPQMMRYRAIAIDAGDKDTGIAETVRQLHAILDNNGVRHVSEIYEGDHVNRIQQRLELKLMPFFTQNLVTGWGSAPLAVPSRTK